MHSLRVKLSLALIATSLSAVIVVGTIAQWRISERFNQIAMDRAFENFQTDVTAYIGLYGSWQAAQQAEPFGRFVERRRGPMGPPPGAPRLPEHEGRMEPFGPEVPMRHNLKPPPFRFVLLDPQGKVLLDGGKYDNGEFVPEAARSGASPIMLDNRLLAWAIPQGKPNLSPADLIYLATIKEALLYAFLIAGSLAIFLGFLFSNRLSKSLHELTIAIRAMSQGELRQQVTVRGKDETAILAKAFNSMSADLTHAYEKLEASNRTIQEQALQLKELSIRDELTQLYNRRYFNEQADKLFGHMKRYNHPLTVMIGDIDHFKQINDRFSHALGDQVLKTVSGILQNNARASDVVARYGGEEFVIIFPETSLRQAAQQCERLRKQIENFPWSTLHPELKVSISIGLSDDLGFDCFERMLAAADSYLYQAKGDGRNRIYARNAL
ncbi:MAG: GGDEF domain-containing protein [Methylobacter sp.]